MLYKQQTNEANACFALARPAYPDSLCPTVAALLASNKYKGQTLTKSDGGLLDDIAADLTLLVPTSDADALAVEGEVRGWMAYLHDAMTAKAGALFHQDPTGQRPAIQASMQALCPQSLPPALRYPDKVSFSRLGGVLVFLVSVLCWSCWLGLVDV